MTKDHFDSVVSAAAHYVEVMSDKMEDVDQLRADKRELVEALRMVSADLRNELIERSIDPRGAWAALVSAAKLITKHADTNTNEL